MSLRLRLTLLLGGLVIATVLGAWIVTGRMVMAPFAQAVMRSYIDEVVFLAERIEEGGDPKALGERLGMDVKLRERPPKPAGKHRGERHRRCAELEVRGRQVVACRGPRAPVAVESARGWVTARRELDPAAPGERASRFLILVALGVLLVSFYVAAVATRPLREMREAMARVARSELDHRLPERGPRELQDLARTFNGMTQRVNEMLRAERALMAGISHELRTPLARLRLELELLREREVPSSRIESMERDLEEINLLIGEMLETSRLAIGERKLARERVALRALAEEAASRVELGDHPLRINGQGTEVQGDRERLLRVLTNLIGNAVKYAPDGTTIELELTPVGLVVRDEGPGVPAEALPRIFEPFYRAQAAGAAKPGFGLGLSVAHQIVTLHGGRIEARNRPTGGFEVEIQLPECGSDPV